MIPLGAYRDRAVGVMGLGGSGLAAARAFAAAGARVLAWDDDPAHRDAAAAEGIALADLGAADLARLELIVWSPGIPHLHPRPHPVAGRARRAGCPLVSDVEVLACAVPAATLVGVTGTNGKSTTTALLGHVLAAAGRDVEVGGNLGPPALARRALGPDGIYVLELSSFQLELIGSARFRIAMLLNVSLDHLDRHGGLHGYVAAKERIFANRRPGDLALVGSADAASRAVVARLRARGAEVRTVAAPADGVLREDGVALDLAEVATLPGAHNAENAAFAWAAARALGVPAAEVAAAIHTYPGLPHRQELVATADGVRYVNDSKATNADSAARALASYRRIYWIAGGLPKDGGIAALAPWFDRIVHAFLIGSAANQFAATLAGRVPCTRAGDLATALAAADAMARRDRIEGAVVLLSPACASYDQWPNYAARGDAFRDVARKLAARRSAA